MRKATELMVQYAAYHRDQRNIKTHSLGIPLIVFGIGVLLARPAGHAGALLLTPAWVLWAAAGIWYLTRGNLVLGASTAAATGALFLLAQQVAGGSVASWLTWAFGTFVFGWLLQFIGHYYEGRKPAFVDDVIGLMVGPMFITGELLFSLGLCRQLQEAIESKVGPTILRNLAHP